MHLPLQLVSVYEKLKQISALGNRILSRTSIINDRYAANRQLAVEMNDKLQESLKYFQFIQDCDNLKEWLDMKTLQAQDATYRDTANIHTKYLHHQKFQAEINSNKERLLSLKQNAEQLKSENYQQIDKNLIDQPQIAELKDSLNESYQDLLELIETRLLSLKTSWKLHKFLHDCKEILLTMEEHTNSVPDEIGRDQQSVQQLLSRDLQLWMNGIIRHMNNSDKPHDVSGVDLLMNNHQSKDLINRQHVRSSEVKEKCIQLSMLRDNVDDTWKERWKYMQLILGVYQLARDAAIAETWLIAPESY
ncbi:unnamed protein product [Rotaria sp. Silwood1]|nr:unnamed protein product [Rotaria sp. Silwood1]